MTTKIVIPNLSNVIRRYQAGASILQLSQELNFSRPVITRALRESDIAMRSQSEQERLKWQRIKLEPSTVKKQLEAAWTARRGMKDKEQTLVARAQANYRQKFKVHYGEDITGNAVSEEGFNVEYQYPVGAYSIDVAIPNLRVAVEVIGSNWKPHHAEHLNKRTEFLLNQGWLVLFTLIWRKEFGLHRQRNSDNTFAHAVRIQPYFNPRKIAQHVTNLAQRLQAGEKLQGKFGVISGNGLPIRTPKIFLDHLPRIPRA